MLQVGVSLGILLSATLVSKQAMRLIGPGNTAPDGTVYERPHEMPIRHSAPPSISTCCGTWSIRA